MAEAIRIDDTTWRIENDFVRFFLLLGNEKAALIDSGYNCEDVRSIVEELTSLPIILINTHGDGDHVSGTGCFDEVYMHESDYISQHLSERFPNTKLKRIVEGEIIDLGGRKLEITEIPGHTFGSIAILDIEARRLFAGDSVQDGSIFMFGNHRAPEQFEGSLNKLKKISDKYDVIIASHGTPELPADYADKVLTCWKNYLDGKLVGNEMEMHGTMIKAYQDEYCGFFCDK